MTNSPSVSIKYSPYTHTQSICIDTQTTLWGLRGSFKINTTIHKYSQSEQTTYTHRWLCCVYNIIKIFEINPKNTKPPTILSSINEWMIICQTK